jgi:hypothetical protein
MWAATANLYELDVGTPSKPVWKDMTSLANAPSARYGHAMAAVNNVIYLFGGSYSGDSGSFYVLATFEERLFAPSWLDLTEFYNGTSFYKQAAAVEDTNVFFQVQILRQKKFWTALFILQWCSCDAFVERVETTCKEPLAFSCLRVVPICILEALESTEYQLSCTKMYIHTAADNATGGG